MCLPIKELKRDYPFYVIRFAYSKHFTSVHLIRVYINPYHPIDNNKQKE